MNNISPAHCEYESCENRVEIRAWCKKHYGVLYRAGKLPKRQPRLSIIDVASKTAVCNVHGEVRLRVRNRRDKVSYHCRACERGSWQPSKEYLREYDKKRRENNPEKAKAIAREKMLRRGKIQHGWEKALSVEEYDSMLQIQGGVCAICEAPPKPERRLAVDHCHSTGKIRGLLCTACNLTLGRFKDDAGRFEAAAEYLRKV